MMIAPNVPAAHIFALKYTREFYTLAISQKCYVFEDILPHKSFFSKSFGIGIDKGVIRFEQCQSMMGACSLRVLQILLLRDPHHP